jgi:D-alanyl-D-alanine dipeptidase
MKISLSIILAICVSFAMAAKPTALKPIPKSTQIILITSADFTTSNASLQRYELKSKKWQKVGNELKIKIGKNGMGWGLGLHKTPKDATIIKKEGDGKSPIGIFQLGDAFGYEPFEVAYPYSVMKEYHHCVDDGKSRFYNQIINSNMKMVKDYDSYENMKFPADYYKYGIVVKHNPNNVPRSGSCIFMHIKSIPTTGCDAMSEAEIKELIIWLKPDANPLLIQAPQSEIKGLLEQAGVEI